MAAISGANIVNDGLSYYLDPSNPVCYSGTGTSVYNLASSSLTGGTLTNGVLYDYSKNGVMYFDGTNDYIAIPDSNLLDLGSSFTISAWININQWDMINNQGWFPILSKTNSSLYGKYRLGAYTSLSGQPSFYCNLGTNATYINQNNLYSLIQFLIFLIFVLFLFLPFLMPTF